MDTVSEVKGKTDIVGIIGEHVKLTRAGRHFKGLCPFHEERTPSFMVSPELQIYKCFGCGESGDVFSFLQKYEGMEFYEALKLLADKAGVTVTPLKGQDTSLKTQVLEANELSAKFYNYILTKHKLGKTGIDYLVAERGLNLETIKTFDIGFAPPNSTFLFDFLTKKKKIKAEIVEQAGLVFKTRSGYMDRFRGRVIFPITNHRGEVVALAGRILPQYDNKKSGKYINSPETLTYHKSDSLYGLSITKNDIRKTRAVVVVEGELDLLSSWQVGVKNIVAIKGTALTEGHVRILARFADTLIMALDSDFAGDSAAIRGLSFAQNAGLEVKIVNLGKYKDPDEFARADSDRLKKSVRAAMDAWQFVINVVAKRFDLTTGSGKAKASRELVPILASIEDSIVRSHYLQKTALKLNVPLEAVAGEVQKNTKEATETEDKPEKEAHKERRELLEEELVAIVITEKMAEMSSIEEFITTPFSGKLLKEAQKFISQNKQLEVSKFADYLPPELRNGFAGMVLKVGVSNSDKQIKSLKTELRKLDLSDERLRITKAIGKAEEKGDQEILIQLQEEYDKLSEELSKL